MRYLSFMLLLVLLLGCGSASVEPTATTVASRPVVGSTDAQPTVPAPPLATAIPAPPEPTAVQPEPTAAPSIPTAVPPAPTAPRPTKQVITLSEPAPGVLAAASVHIEGVATMAPFEKSLVGQVRDAEGNVLGQAAFMTEGEYGEPARFSTDIPFVAPAMARPGKVLVFDYSARDGSIIAVGVAEVELAGGDPLQPRLTLPAAGPQTLPLHVEAVGLRPNAEYTVLLSYADGTVLEQRAFALPLPDGTGTLVLNMDWATESAPPNPDSQEALLQVLAPDGTSVAEQHVMLLNRADAGLVMPIKVYFVLGEQLQEVTRYVPRSEAVAAAALRELSWGPAGNEQAAAGMESLLPAPEQVTSYPGRQPDWSGRVYLRSIHINDGVAYVDWSPEMRAWGGGSAALQMLNAQVTQTLLQFPTIQRVEMTVMGSQEVLQP